MGTVESVPATRLLERLVVEVRRLLGPDVLGVYVHGSYVAGDFAPARSDVDLAVVLVRDPTEELVAPLRRMHADVVADYPDWSDRVEVEYLSPDAIRDCVSGPRPMIRISPGEPVHLVTADRHYLPNWYAVRRQGRALYGPAPATLLAPISDADLHAVVGEHLAQWPHWVRQCARPGQQAYAVLTVCRAACLLNTGAQVSKRRAAAYGRRAFAEWTELIGWAENWWYGGGRDDEPDRGKDVVAFVVAVVDRVALPSR